MLRGRPWRDLGRGGSEHIIEELRQQVLRSFQDNALGRELVVIEGMGSPVEMNLKDRDVTNMWLAKAVRSPVVLAGDIEKGGVFAGLYGTYLLMDQEERGLLKGFIINRFRGDASILKAGIEELESRMEVPCLGVLPKVTFPAPPEDSMDISRDVCAGTDGGDVRQHWVRGLDHLLGAWEGALDLQALERIAERG